jgi:hypothetical protein
MPVVWFKLMAVPSIFKSRPAMVSMIAISVLWVTVNYLFSPKSVEFTTFVNVVYITLSFSLAYLVSSILDRRRHKSMSTKSF